MACPPPPPARSSDRARYRWRGARDCRHRPRPRRRQRTGARFEQNAFALARHRTNRHAVAHAHAARAHFVEQRRVELRTSHDPPNGCAVLEARRQRAHRRLDAQSCERCARYVDAHADGIEQAIGPRADGSCADFLTRKASLVEQHQSLGEAPIVGPQSAGGSPGRAATDDSDVVVTQFVSSNSASITPSPCPRLQHHRALPRGALALGLLLLAGRFVHDACHTVRFLLESLERCTHLVVVLFVMRLARIENRLFDRRAIALRDLVLVLADGLFEVVAEVVEPVAPFDLLALLPVLGLVVLGLADHAFDVGVLRPEPSLMVTFCSLPVAMSRAWTLRMPLASMSNATSILGTPRGAGMMPSRLNLPSVRL